MEYNELNSPVGGIENIDIDTLFDTDFMGQEDMLDVWRKNISHGYLAVIPLQTIPGAVPSIIKKFHEARRKCLQFYQCIRDDHRQ